MAWYDIFRPVRFDVVAPPSQESKEAELARNQLKKYMPPRAITSRYIERTQLWRDRMDILDWRMAINDAERIDYPDRVDLIRLYNDVDLDTHVEGLVSTIFHRVMANEYVFIKNGKKDDKLKKLFSKKWFYDFVRFTLQSNYYGFSLIEFDEITPDRGLVNPRLVPREYVDPCKKLIHKVLYGSEEKHAVNFMTTKSLRDYLILVDTGHLGLYMKCAQMFIFKKIGLTGWTEYNERFGVPTIIGKTERSNENDRAQFENMMKNISGASSGVIDMTDEVDMLEHRGTGTADNFRYHNQSLNEEISKCLLGQTMVLDNGAARSQAEVHEKNANLFIRAYMRMVQFTINDELLPMMEYHRAIPKGVEFQWSNREALRMVEKIQVDNILMQHFQLDDDYIEDTYGTPVSKKEVPVSPFNNPKQEEKQRARDRKKEEAEPKTPPTEKENQKRQLAAQIETLYNGKHNH